MKNRNRFVIIAIIIVSCVVMAAVETIIEPAYIVKSAVKVFTFLLLPLAVMKIFNINSSADLFALNKKNIIGLLLLGMLIYLCIIVTYVITSGFFDYSALVISLSEDQQVDSRNFIWVALYISFCNSFLEEFLFRFISFIRLSSYMSRKAAYLFSSVMFALYHVAMIGPSFPWQMLILALVGLTAGGLIFDLIDAKSGNIYPSWFVHMFADLSLMTIWYMNI